MRRFLPAIVALGAGLVIITVLIALSSDSPAVPLAVFFFKPFSSWFYFGNMLNMAGLMIFAATGSAFALKSGSFNLGGEAQIYAPALVVAVMLSGSPPVTAVETAGRVALALAAAVGTGALLGFVPGALKARFRISELLTSFLLSAALLPVIDFLVSGPLRDQSKNLLATKAIHAAYRLAPFLKPSSLNISFPVAVILAISAGLFLRNTTTGYRLRVTGTAGGFARFAGFPVDSVPIVGMTVSGIFHALAGFFSITGTWFMCHNGFSSGMGWSALAIALIARHNLFAVVPAAILYAWLQTASEAAVLTTRFSFDSTALVQAVIFLCISAQVFPLPGLKEKRP